MVPARAHCTKISSKLENQADILRNTAFVCDVWSPRLAETGAETSGDGAWQTTPKKVCVRLRMFGSWAHRSTSYLCSHHHRSMSALPLSLPKARAFKSSSNNEARSSSSIATTFIPNATTFTDLKQTPRRHIGGGHKGVLRAYRTYRRAKNPSYCREAAAGRGCSSVYLKRWKDQ
jgi:hypothetical protein